jgi:hypothetical protein
MTQNKKLHRCNKRNHADLPPYRLFIRLYIGFVYGYPTVGNITGFGYSGISMIGIGGPDFLTQAHG